MYKFIRQTGKASKRGNQIIQSQIQVDILHDDVYLDELINQFEVFLANCGFDIEGKHLEIVDDVKSKKQ